MDTVKNSLTRAPVLRFYNVNKPVTVQCDASQTGLGAVLLQENQPVCYASRALTDAETRYAQIENELLAIVWACDKFDQYVYSRDIITVETDHEPLKAIFKKEIQVTQTTAANATSPAEIQPGCSVQERIADVHR